MLFEIINEKFDFKNLQFAFLLLHLHSQSKRKKILRMKQSVATRLKLFMDNEGLSHSQFADKSSIPRPTLSQLLSGRNKKISDVLVGQIHRAFPRLSVLWLMFGEGEMLLEGDNVLSDSVGQISDDSIFAPDSTIDFIESQENALEMVSNDIQNSVSERVNIKSEIVDSKRQINQIARNPRKVIQITVYYDDNTFETFMPNINI